MQKFVFVLVKNKTFPHIMIKSNELQSFLPRNFDSLWYSISLEGLALAIAQMPLHNS